MNTDRAYAIVVDDKRRPREWGIAALIKAGFSPDKIIPSYYGDHAYALYKSMRQQGKQIDLVLSDFHMDVTRKPPQDYIARFRNATILSGIELGRMILRENPEQKFCLFSAGINPEVIAESETAGIQLTLYKRRPEDKKFSDYVDVISDYVDGKEDLKDRCNKLLPALYETKWSSGGASSFDIR